MLLNFNDLILYSEPKTERTEPQSHELLQQTITSPTTTTGVGLGSPHYRVSQLPSIRSKGATTKVR
jgi:hypothetical protein